MNRKQIAYLVGLLLPWLVCLAMVPARRSIPNTDAALVLVVVVVAAATFGVRPAGYLSALSAGIAFDLLLTVPYGSLSIHSREDVETAGLVLLVGAAVTEIAAQGWRQRRISEQRSDYLTGLRRPLDGEPSEMVEQASRMLVEVLQLSRCRFRLGTGDEQPRLEPDGSVRWGDARWDVDAEGLPRQVETALPVGRAGRFLLAPAPDTHPDRLARIVAVTVADQLATALAAGGRSRTV